MSDAGLIIALNEYGNNVVECVCTSCGKKFRFILGEKKKEKCNECGGEIKELE